ncbi:MAG: glycosyltransferase [Candidatus Aenigmarchaeota archaeon]|nr:glycosyltransferase [Candidatus Aenigmarchaeota archaeon]
MKLYKVIAIIPAYNEEKNIGKTVKAAKKYVDKVIVVDDGSFDNTSKIARKSGAEVIRYEENKGVGFASRTGLKKAISLKPYIIVFLDADGQLNPKYIPEFVKEIKKGSDYVYGKRNLRNYPINRKIGNWSLTILANLFCPTKIRDVECGFRAFTYKTAKKMDLRAMEYEREVDFIYEIWRNKIKVSYVEINVTKFYPKAAISRGLKNFWFLIKRRFNLI